MPTHSPTCPDGVHLHRALSRVTEALACELATPGTNCPDWSADYWALARAVAVMHGIGPLLAVRATWRAPDGWVSFLEGQRAHTARRHVQLVATLGRIGELATAAGIAVVALKGSELHRLGIYQAGERPMADIDLLAREADCAPVSGLLGQMGFEGGATGWKDQLFVTARAGAVPGFGESDANPVKIELHRRIVERLPWRLVPLPVDILPVEPRPGLVPYPSCGVLMTHLLLHAAGTMPTRTLRMMHLHDLASLAARMEDSDWNIVLEAADRRTAWWAYPPLQLAARYFKAAIPLPVRQSLRRCCPPRLARWADGITLFDASHSYPWVEAFPGIHWSQSFAERVVYAANRVFPARSMRRQRRVLASTEAWTDMTWSRRSQGRRAVQFLKGKQTRPSTMHLIRGAFETPV